MPIAALDHVQLAMPPGGEDEARRFYTALLGLKEIPKPENLARRGGCWFELGTVKVHLGVEREFSPARKAHPAFEVTGLESLIEILSEGGHPTRSDEPLEGWKRVYVDDPFGNRIELMERL
jgi:catechol 2,3-dioxygenase-like lactoylglutathione lyase family enzyme